MQDNAEVALENGLSDEQIEALEYLCAKRHEMHSNIDSLIINQSDSLIVKDLTRAGIHIVESGLPAVNGLPAYSDDYIDIDDIALLEDDAPEDAEKYKSWYDDTYSEIYSEWEKLNTKIEKYLSEIDRKYNTNYCPTGAQRIF